MQFFSHPTFAGLSPDFIARFDVVINCDPPGPDLPLATLFRNIHDAARLGGLMIYQWPLAGLRPSERGAISDFLTHLVAANGYEPVSINSSGPKFSMVCRKVTEGPFFMPAILTSDLH